MSSLGKKSRTILFSGKPVKCLKCLIFNIQLESSKGKEENILKKSKQSN